MSKSELPSVTIEGRPYWALWIAADEGPLPPGYERSLMNEGELAQLLAALPDEQRERVLEPFLEEGLEQRGRAIIAEARLADVQRELEQERERSAKLDELVGKYEAQWGAKAQRTALKSPTPKDPQGPPMTPPITPREIALWSAVYAATWTHQRAVEKRSEHICHAIASEEAKRALEHARDDWRGKETR